MSPVERLAVPPLPLVRGPKVCHRCGETFEGYLFGTTVPTKPVASICDPCGMAWDAEQAAKDRRIAVDYWRQQLRIAAKAADREAALIGLERALRRYRDALPEQGHRAKVEAARCDVAERLAQLRGKA